MLLPRIKIILFLCFIGSLITAPSFAKLEALIFDCDGVLIDSEYEKFISWQTSLKKYNITFTIEEYLPLVGLSSEAIKNTIEITKNIKLSDTLISEKNEIYAIRQKNTKPFKTNLDFLFYAFKRKQDLGFKLALASSASKREINSNLKKLGITHIFDLIVSGEDDLNDINDLEGTNKPKPYIYQKIIKLLKIQSTNAIVFEDSNAGILAAKNAGLYAIAIPNEFTKNQDFSKADAIIMNSKVLNLLIL